MKNIFLGMAMCVMFTLVACSSAPEFATFSELSKDNQGKIYYGNSLYTGTATSEDGVFLTMEVEKGVIKNIEARHNNGALAMTSSSEDETFALYNEFGEQIDEHEYRINYMGIQKRIDEELMKLQSK